MRTRWKVLGGPIAAASVVAAVLVWGVAVEPRFILDTREVTARLPNLPSAWEGRRIALIGDLQIGMWWDNPHMVARAIDRAIVERPAMALIAGDFVYGPDSSKVRRAVGLVRPLAEAGIPTFAVLGNHDFGLSDPAATPDTAIAAYLEEELEKVGIEVLENESAVLEIDGSALHVVGIGSEWADRADPAAALAGVPDGAARIVIMHNPIAYRDLPPHSSPAAFAAHTHGGQIRIPGTPSESWLSIARPREVVADGWSRKDVGAAGNRLYVNRGLGFSIVPIRIFCPPELTFFTLSSEPDSTGGASVAAPSEAAPPEAPDVAE